MKRSVTKIKFHSPTISRRDVKGNIPEQFSYVVNYARRAKLTGLEAGSVLRQEYRNFLFYMEVFSFHLTTGLEISFTVKKPSAFMFFMLEGQVHFSLPGGRPVAVAGEGKCYAAFNTPGAFAGKLEKGWHHFVYINARAAWLWRHVNDFSGLREFLQWMESGHHPYGHMPQVDPDRAMARKLKQLFSPQEENKDIETWHLGLCKALLKRYHQLTFRRYEDPVYRVRQFIERNYTSHQLMTVSALSDRFGIYLKKLERDYQKEFLMTPGDYIRLLRMEHARHLLLQGLLVREVSDSLDYKNVPSFIRAFKSYYGHPPGSIQGQNNPVKPEISPRRKMTD